MQLAVLLIVLYILTTPNQVLALNSPTQLTPINNSQVTTSKLTWEIPSYSLYSNNPYRVQVDDNSDFSSIYRDYSTKNTYYTPVLTEGNWFWRLKAKDSTGTWSDWSNVWSFSLLNSSPSPSPSPEPENASSSASPIPSSTFSISSTPTEITSEETFKVSVTLSLTDKPNTQCYLKGAFRHPDNPNNYFGRTLVGSSWIKNSDGAINQFPITTDQNGYWTGTLDLQPDSEDSGFLGTGDYLFKVGFYSSSGAEVSSVSWSNEVTIKITQTSSDDNQEIASTALSPSPSTSPEASPSPSKTAVKSSKPTPSESPKTSPKKNSVARLLEEIKISPLPAILGASTSSSQASNAAQPKSLLKGADTKSLILIGLGILIVLLGVYFAFGQYPRKLWKRTKN